MHASAGAGSCGGRQQRHRPSKARPPPPPPPPPPTHTHTALVSHLPEVSVGHEVVHHLPQLREDLVHLRTRQTCTPVNTWIPVSCTPAYKAPRRRAGRRMRAAVSGGGCMGRRLSVRYARSSRRAPLQPAPTSPPQPEASAHLGEHGRHHKLHNKQRPPERRMHCITRDDMQR